MFYANPLLATAHQAYQAAYTAAGATYPAMPRAALCAVISVLTPFMTADAAMDLAVIIAQRSLHETRIEHATLATADAYETGDYPTALATAEHYLPKDDAHFLADLIANMEHDEDPY